MAAPPLPHHSFTEPSPFFRLSPEIRLVIYDYVLPQNGQLYVDLCTPTRPDGEEFVLRKRSIVSTLLKRVMELEGIVRGGGLQMLVSLLLIILFGLGVEEEGVVEVWKGKVDGKMSSSGEG